MQKRLFSRMIFLILLIGVACWGGCKAKQEAESLPRTSANSRQMAALPKTQDSGQAYAADTAPAGTPAPIPPPNRSPVIVKPPKLLEVQTPPPLEKSAEAAPKIVSSDPPRSYPEASNPKASKAMISAAAPGAGALQPPTAPTEEHKPDRESKAPFFQQIESALNNPLRDEPATPPTGEAASAPIAKDLAQKSEPENVPNTQSMIPAPMIPPPAQLADDPSPAKDQQSGALPMTSAPAGAAPPPPSARLAASATPVTTALSSSGDYDVVKVFYGTDRAALGTASAKNAVARGYFLLTIAAAALTVLLAFAAFRFLRWRSIKALYILSLSSTIFLGALSGYAALYGRLPGQAVPAIKSAAFAYGDGRGTLELGSCDISIPKQHVAGELESPSMLRLEFQEDPLKHVVLLKVEPEAADRFYANLRDRVANAKENSALVFIHGYNVTFEDAARRTAQIAYDLKFAGVPIFYSWPSQGKLLDYEVDETNVVWTVAHLRQFLADVARQSGAKQIHLIAHSMGNRALAGALKNLASQQTGSSRPQFDQVLLTAPDIDADLFKNEIAPAITKAAERVTLYASSNDAALLLSKKLHGYPRAGEAGRDIVIVPGMDTVDVTAVDTSLLGHSYYGDSGSVLSDFVEVLQDAKPADERKWLHPEYLGAAKYWVFQR